MVERYDMKMHHVYMIKNNLNDLYIGISENPEKRLIVHNQNDGANFTKGNNKFRIVFLESYDNNAESRKREIQLKKWSRKKKEMLIDLYSKGCETRKCQRLQSNY